MGNKDSDIRLSLPTLRVLEGFLDTPTQPLSGADLRKRHDVASGTLYPILLRLEEAGWLTSRWEKADPSRLGRPRKRLYVLTATGLRRASEAFATFRRGVLA